MASQTKTLVFYKDINKALDWVDICCTKIIDSAIPAYITVSNEPPEQQRSSNENRKFHAIMSDIHRQGVMQFGPNTIVLSKYSFEECKTLLIAWFVEELKELGENIPKYAEVKTLVCPKTGKVYNQRGSTTKYSDKFCRLLCQFLWSTGAEIGVKFTDPATREYEKIMHSGEIK